MNKLNKYECPIDCPNRKSALGKGYSFLSAIAVVIMFVVMSSDIKYVENKLQYQTKEVPLSTLALVGGGVLAALGINTDSIAEKFGRFLSKD